MIHSTPSTDELVKVFALGDPHFGRDMSRFGAVWNDHEAAIEREWQDVVDPDDLVLLPGDFSWATTTKTICKHLDLVDRLPGRVVISPGNHDKWWKKTPRLHYDSIRFLDNDHVPLGDGWTIAAVRGCDTVESPWWKDEMATELEGRRRDLETTLAATASSMPESRILLMIHYPPRWDRAQTPTVFEEIIAKHPVDHVVYGHIHGQDLRFSWNETMDVVGRPVRYDNVSCDHVECRPRMVLEIAEPVISWGASESE